MALPFLPRGVYASVTALSPSALRARGVTLVLADLDNTLAPYRAVAPDAEIIRWKQALEREGITLFILSNSRKPARVAGYAAALGVEHQAQSGKPRRAGYLRALERMGKKPEETVMVGDQIFTDTLGAGRAGIPALLVRPIRLAGNPGRYIRYAIETPFRLLGARRPFL